MTASPQGLRKQSWAVLSATAVVAATAALSEQGSWHVPPGTLVLLGVMGLVVVNIGVFSVNLLLSMRKWRKAKTEDELRDVAVPALRGEPTQLGAQAVRVASVLLAACLGIILGGVVVIVYRWVR